MIKIMVPGCIFGSCTSKGRIQEEDGAIQVMFDTKSGSMGYKENGS